ncbi:MAG: TrkH family potassium uptake protein [Acidimicrobiales bacterium]|nr:TrkH family potassium uptake protein [Acidimicrobiales bacterium]
MNLLTSHRSSDGTALARPPRGRPNTALHVAGIALTFVSAGMGITTVVELASTNLDTGALAISTVVCGSLGGLLWYFTRAGTVRTREVFAAVGWTWLSVTLIGSLPFIIAGTFATPGTDFVEQVVNSIFESASGFSATGSTALTDFSGHGRGMLLYRQATQWYGGMGIVVLAVSVLPFLGVGGLDLITAEAPGPSSDRLAPRVSETARQLWVIYVLFTLTVMAVLFVIPGPSFYDSVAHALSTTSTGGFSPYSESIGHYDSLAVEIAIIAGMLYGGINFSLHWRAARGELTAYSRDSELRTFLGILLVAVSVVVLLLWLDSGDPVDGLGDAMRYGGFNVVALGTSTGFGNATGAEAPGDFVHWASGAQIVILFLFVMGGSTGSTSGGIKVMRVQVLFAHTIRSIRRTQQPQAVLPVKHGKFAVAEDIVSRMAGFFLLYVLLISVGVVLVTGLGGGFEESIGAVIGSLGNMGPALGEAGPTANFSDAFPEPARLVLAAFMLIGRLEIFPMLLMFAAPYRVVSDAIRR